MKTVSLTGAGHLREWFSYAATRVVRLKWPLTQINIGNAKELFVFFLYCLSDDNVIQAQVYMFDGQLDITKKKQTLIKN